MSYRTKAIAAALLSFAAIAPASIASAADLPVKAKAKPVPDLPFFLVIDNRVTYSYIFTGTDPGVWTRKPDGSINGKTAKQVYSFTHFDIWQYGTNFFTISMFKSDHNDPANPCFNNAAGQIVEVSVEGYQYFPLAPFQRLNLQPKIWARAYDLMETIPGGLPCITTIE